MQSGATVKVANNDLRPKQIQSNATSGVLQVAGPAAASTRVMTTPDANFTVARTDAAQSFTGDQTLSTGNLIIGTSGKGIDFSATPGTGTSELFADYEEGTWTPVVTPGAGAITSYSSGGFYTKIGRSVSITGYFSLTNAGTASGACNITGLPFTTNATARQIGTSREDAATGGTYQFFVLASSTSAALVSIAWNTGYQYNFTIVYQTA